MKIIIINFLILNSENITVIFLTALFTFIISFLLFRLFIYKKIRSISEKIKLQRTTKQKPQTTSNALNELDKEVSKWISERKEEIEKLQKLETYRKEFLGNVSHELKTPIFNIQGHILTLLDGGLEDPTINRDYLVRAEKNVDRMISIIEDLEAISQLETGELQLEFERFDILPVIKEIFESQEMKAKKRKINLTLMNTFEKPVFVFADKFRIKQVFTNLIVNSIKYGKEDGETRVKISDTGENIIVEVSDNGIGISKEHLPRLFERFYRVDKSRSREQGGTGLGLAIVKHLIEAHNQTINVMSTEGVGSVFSFTLKKASGDLQNVDGVVE